MHPGFLPPSFLRPPDGGRRRLMTLELRNVTKRVGAETHIYETNLVLPDNSLNVLLGATLAGKTTLMQLMAGLDTPTSGEIWFRGKNVTGVPVQKRNVSMVYQQFINYPNLTVEDNIATPLRVAGFDKSVIASRVGRAAELLRLTPMLKRRPSELSGGQQQRTAIARAIVKDSDVILFDEPLANLDYKLREELRDELPKLFAERNCVVVYATSEPSEALLFGGNTATLEKGRVTQFGPTAEGYRRPRDIVSAEVFSDPPINTHSAVKEGKSFVLAEKDPGGKGKPHRITIPVPQHLAGVADGPVTLGVQPHHLSLEEPFEKAPALKVRTQVSEIAGSESFVHVLFGDKRWVMLAHGVCNLDPELDIDIHLDTRHLMAFGADGTSLSRNAG